jgi:hypothetical protein
MRRNRRLAALAVVALLIAPEAVFAQQTSPRGELRVLPPADAWSLISNSTIAVEGSGSRGPFRGATYTAPDGSGFSFLDPLPGNTGAPERTQTIETYSSQAGGWCRIRTRNYTQMPAHVSLSWICNQIARDSTGAYWILSARHNEGAPPIRVVSISSGDRIPAAIRAEWEREVRARFGGRIPAWTPPEVTPPPR